MGTPNDTPGPGGAEPPAEIAPVNPVPRDLRRIWRQLIDQPWSTLAVVSSERTELARAVADAGTDLAHILDLREIVFLDARSGEDRDAARLVAEVSSRRAAGDRVVVALDPPRRTSAALPLLMRADAVLLLVRLGATDGDFVKSVIEIVGRERVVGYVTHR